jgi:2-dehydro-3-deoxyphosphogluconate aldolase/(4S)-4-hydroxy-2-oxoglutarate aldolase
MLANIEQSITTIKERGIIAIVRGDFPLDDLLLLGDTMAHTPVSIIEITLNTTGALAAISALRQRLGERLLVGAGTVRTAGQFEAALTAGAQFTVAPNFDPATVARAQASDLLHLPGVFTPTEAQTAFAAGCRMLKLFPSDLTGAAHLKALRAPLDDIEFVPTGGIGLDNIAAYARAGAAAVGVGSSLLPKSGWTSDAIIDQAKALHTAWLDGRGETLNY